MLRFIADNFDNLCVNLFIIIAVPVAVKLRWLHWRSWGPYPSSVNEWKLSGGLTVVLLVLWNAAYFCYRSI